MDKKLNNSDLKLLRERLKVEWTYTSNAIEGNTISLGDTAFIIEHGLTIKGKSVAEHTEIIGHAKAVDLIYDLVKKEAIDKEDLFLLHKAVQANLVVDIECPIGAYKVVANARYIRIDGKLEHRYYPQPEHTKHLMELWFDQFEDISKPIDNFDACVNAYTDMHVTFTSIHPFFDGNGRLARLISNIPLIKNGYLPIIISNKQRQEYIQLLSNYNLTAKTLDGSSSQLIEKNEEYQKVRAFFAAQYANAQELLDEIKRNKQ